jgi:hypothetical protein
MSTSSARTWVPAVAVAEFAFPVRLQTGQEQSVDSGYALPEASPSQ